MQTLYVPQYNLHYRINPKNPKELQWSRKPFGPATAWQHAMSFKKPIKALDIDDKTKRGVVVLNDSSTYVGSGVRTWCKKFYPAGTRIYSLYAIGESKTDTIDVFGHKAKVITKNDTNTYVYVVVANRDEALALKKKLKDNGITTMQATREATNYRVSFSIPNGKTLESKDMDMKQNCSMLRKQESLKESQGVIIDDSYIKRLTKKASDIQMCVDGLKKVIDTYDIPGKISVYDNEDSHTIVTLRLGNYACYDADLDDGILYEVPTDREPYKIDEFEDFVDLQKALSKQLKDFQ